MFWVYKFVSFLVCKFYTNLSWIIFVLSHFSRIITGVKIFYHYCENFLSQAWKNFFIGLKILVACLFSLFGLSNSLRIRGYFIKYSRIFHHVSMDISLRIRGYASFLLCPRDLLVVCSWVFSYWWFCFYSHKSHRSHEIFFHRWIFLSRESRESHEVFFHRWFWSHTDLTNLTKAYIAYARMYHPAENTRRSRQARAKRRAICEICEICVRYIHRTWFFAFFARFAWVRIICYT